VPNRRGDEVLNNNVEPPKSCDDLEERILILEAELSELKNTLKRAINRTLFLRI